MKKLLMNIQINGKSSTTHSKTLQELVRELEHEPESIATAVNQLFVPIAQRESYHLSEDDSVDIIAPMAGG